MFAQSELSPLIEVIFSGKDGSDMVRSLRGDDAQTFIDVMNEVPFCTLSSSQTMIDRFGIGTFCRLGTRRVRAFTTDPKEVHQTPVQDLSHQRTSSECLEDSHLL